MMKTRVVVLAAGKSKRMKSDVPKVLIPFDGKPLVSHLLETIKISGIDLRPVVVVNSATGPLIQNQLGNEYDYVTLDEPLGTAHGVQATEDFLKGKADRIIVLYGDHPFLTAQTIKNLHDLHEKYGGPIAMLTATIENFDGWQVLFRDFGRVKRDQSGNIQSSIEIKDATPEEQRIKEVNPCFYSFDATWLWDHIKKVENKNAQKEYYLTDLVKMAIDEGHRIPSQAVSPQESVGINTPEQLDIVKKLH